MNFIKFVFVIIFFIIFFFLFKHYTNLENYKFNNKSTIPIIESDNKPFKILPPPEDNNNPLKNSCTLNDEC